MEDVRSTSFQRRAFLPTLEFIEVCLLHCPKPQILQLTLAPRNFQPTCEHFPYQCCWMSCGCLQCLCPLLALCCRAHLGAAPLTWMFVAVGRATSRGGVSKGQAAGDKPSAIAQGSCYQQQRRQDTDIQACKDGHQVLAFVWLHFWVFFQRYFSEYG